MATDNPTPSLRLETPDRTASDESTDDQTRDDRARTEQMLVIPETDDENTCVGLYTVYSASGNEYTVDLDGVDVPCSCPDMEYHRPADGCKHIRRIEHLIQTTPLPAPDESAADYDDYLVEMLESLRPRVLILEQFLDVLRRETGG